MNKENEKDYVRFLDNVEVKEPHEGEMIRKTSDSMYRVAKMMFKQNRMSTATHTQKPWDC